MAGFGAGIGGPYDDERVVLNPGSDSQSWEGLQGTDSLSPLYLPPDNKTWVAFYGSAQMEHATVRPHNMSWYNGLVTASRLGDPFVRRTPSSLVNFNQGFSENLIVSYLASCKAYIAVFDALDAEANGVGVSWSSDGLNWDTPSSIGSRAWRGKDAAGSSAGARREDAVGFLHRVRQRACARITRQNGGEREGISRHDYTGNVGAAVCGWYRNSLFEVKEEIAPLG